MTGLNAFFCQVNSELLEGRALTSLHIQPLTSLHIQPLALPLPPS